MTSPSFDANPASAIRPAESGAFRHLPVLLDESLEALQPAPGKIIVDGTLGGGGHAEAFLTKGAQVIGLDQDEDALRAATARLVRFGEAFHPVKANFRDLASVLADLQIEKIDGLLLDIGVSSHQLDTPARGFSFQNEGPLDMRMDQRSGRSAADWVNHSELEELIAIFRRYGEEPASVRIARHLVNERQKQPFITTTQLAGAVAVVHPRRGKKHPATQIFQALRIAVNDELGALETLLSQAPDLLAEGARFAVITFHSLEDRMVKQDFRTRSQAWLDRPEWSAPRANPACVYRLLQRKSLTASKDELTNNPRARSARLRVVEKLTHKSHVTQS